MSVFTFHSIRLIYQCHLESLDPVGIYVLYGDTLAILSEDGKGAGVRNSIGHIVNEQDKSQESKYRILWNTRGN